jgi:putative DNA primase/helicase
MSDDEIRSLVDEAEEFEPDEDDQQPQNAGPQQLVIGSDFEIAEKVAGDLRARHGEAIFSEGDFWIYVRTHWLRVPDHELHRAVRIYDGAQYGTGTAIIRLNKARADSIISELGMMLSRPDFFANPPKGINCDSGFIEFAEDGTPSQEPHDPAHRCRHVLKGRWLWPRLWLDLYFDRSLLRRLIEGVFRDDPDIDKKMALLQEIAGAAALGYGTRLRQPRAVILAGPTAENGKSQILDLYRSLLPPEAIASISAGKMGDERLSPMLTGKYLNASDELSAATAIASDAFKAIVTGDPITGRQVYVNGTTFRPVAQHVFCTNTLPNFAGGMDRGVRRRLLVIPFNRVIPKEERVERIGQRIGEEESNLLLDWAVEGASRLIRQREFTVPPSSEAALHEWLRTADPVLAWIEQYVTVVDPQSPEWDQAKIKSAEAYARFKRFAIAEGYRENMLPAIAGFVSRLTASRSAIVRKHTSTGNWLVGIRISDRDKEAFFGGRME